MPKTRLDQLLVARGLAQSRERARAVILAGDVTVGGRPISKAGTLVDDQAEVAVRTADHPWVGRGGLKPSTSRAASRSMWAPRPAASRTCFSSEARAT